MRFFLKQITLSASLILVVLGIWSCRPDTNEVEEKDILVILENSLSRPKYAIVSADKEKDLSGISYYDGVEEITKHFKGSWPDTIRMSNYDHLYIRFLNRYGRTGNSGTFRAGDTIFISDSDGDLLVYRRQNQENVPIVGNRFLAALPHDNIHGDYMNFYDALWKNRLDPKRYQSLVQDEIDKYSLKSKLLDSLYESNLIDRETIDVHKATLKYDLYSLALIVHVREIFKTKGIYPNIEDLQRDDLIGNLAYLDFIERYATEELIGGKRVPQGENATPPDFPALIDQLEFQDNIGLETKNHLNYFALKNVREYFGEGVFTQKYNRYKNLSDDSMRMNRIDLKYNLKLDTTVTATHWLMDRNGRNVTLEDIYDMNKRYAIYIDFWATWCLPCLEEMPTLERMVDSLATRQIKIVMISLDRDKDAWSRKIQGFDRLATVQHYQVVNSKPLKALGITSIPRHFYISKNRQLTDQYAPSASSPLFLEYFDQR